MVMIAMMSPPSKLFLEGSGGDCDALTPDVLQDVDLVRQRPTGEDLENLERALQGPVRPLRHHPLDGIDGESGHVAGSLRAGRSPGSSPRLPEPRGGGKALDGSPSGALPL